MSGRQSIWTFFTAFAVLAAVCLQADAQNFMRKPKPEEPQGERAERELKVTVKVGKPDTVTPPKYTARILRDEWGVPHIFGESDADAAYGLGFAHAEDDFKTIQETLIMVRGRSAEINGAEAAPIDLMVHMLGIWDDVEAKYESDLSAESRAISEAYAEAINDYAEVHPDEILLDVFPVSGKDIVAGFAFRSPFFYGLDGEVMELFKPERQREVSQRAAAKIDGVNAFAKAGFALRRDLHLGSNTFAVGPGLTADGGTYLNVNSHQPWTGPVAWYEAHVHSEEGWEAVGGTFPGAPLILHGHNRHLGWAHTVNKPDLVDIYVLTTNPDNENQYWFDGEWRDLEVKKVRLRVRVNPDSPMTMPVNREVLRSVHGPVVKQPHGTYAIRYAGMGEIRQVDQWLRMNKATNLDEWLDAMKMRSVSSLNCGYADKDGNILYLYNASLPIRADGYDWKQYLPGDTSETLWTETLPFEDLPMVLNPPSGFVQNCNSTPFKATFGEGNPSVFDFSETFGIETHQTNRALRALELFSTDPEIDFNEFYAYKFDMQYSENSNVAAARDQAVAAAPTGDPLIDEALEVLRSWDLGTDPENPGAALGVMALRPRHDGVASNDELMERLKEVAQNLKAAHGRVDPPWREVNRLRRGTVDLGIGGGPDILHAVYGGETEEGGHLVGRAGDSYILLVAWDAQGEVHSRSIHQFGSATMDESSPHYADQAQLFVNRRMKPVWLEPEEIRLHLERSYRPEEVLREETD